VFGALTALRVNFFEDGIEIPSNFSLLYVNNTYLGYYDDYIALGLTPHFKKIPPPPPQPKNDTNEDDNKKNNTSLADSAYNLLDKLMTGLYDLTEKVT